MDWGAGYFGTVLVIVGGLLALLKRKRRFDRTNQFGVEQFPSYRRKLATTSMDRIIGFGSLGLLTAGVLLLALRFEDSWGWAVLLPVYLFGLYLLIGS